MRTLAGVTRKVVVIKGSYINEIADPGIGRVDVMIGNQLF
jgi:hypothetical protein